MGDLQPDEAPLSGEVIGGRWRIGPVVGTGGVGTVYRGQHTETERTVAVKVLQSQFAKQPEFRKRFEREARAASKLSHPACVSVLDFGEHEGRLYLVMEFAAGHLLVDRLRDGPLEPAEAVAVARGVAIALRHAHGLGVVHRDLKPGNVMLLDDAQSGVGCKLLDFGGAKSMGRDPREQLTGLNMVFCSPSYLSPEQALGNPADARSDLYALGIVLWEMLCGRRPFQQKDTMAMIQDHIRTPAPRVRTIAKNVSPELDALTARMLEKDPAARFQTAQEVLEALAALPEARSAKPLPQTGPAAIATTPTHARPRGPWLAVAALAALAALGLMLMRLLRR
jgi:serine/threonine-protein kinase